MVFKQVAKIRKVAKVHGIHGNRFCDFKEWGVSTKKIMSQQQLVMEYYTVSNSSKGITLLFAVWICKLSYLNIHEIQ